MLLSRKALGYLHMVRSTLSSTVTRADSPTILIVAGVGRPIAANRGASGIDGVLSTAAGFADGLRRPVTLLVGDVSFLHDANGLNLLRTGAPMCITSTLASS